MAEVRPLGIGPTGLPTEIGGGDTLPADIIPGGGGGGGVGERRFSESGNYQYCGQADLGASEGASVWLIRRLTYASGVYTVTQEADNVDWTGRAGHTYV